MKKSLLIQEPPLQVLPSLATLIGLNEALVLQQVHYWLENPKNAGYIDEDGNKWIYNKYEDWQKDNFPFWSVSTVKRTFQNLENGGLVITAQLKAKQRDMTKYYRIDYEMLETMHEFNLTSSNGSKRTDVNNTETTTEIEVEEADNVFRTYESEIGIITPAIADALDDWLRIVPPKWIKDAVHICAQNNARSWKYAETILKRWKAQGNQNDDKPKQGKQERGRIPTPSVPKGVGAVMAWLEKSEVSNGD